MNEFPCWEVGLTCLDPTLVLWDPLLSSLMWLFYLNSISPFKFDVSSHISHLLTSAPCWCPWPHSSWTTGWCPPITTAATPSPFTPSGLTPIRYLVEGKTTKGVHDLQPINKITDFKHQSYLKGHLFNFIFCPMKKVAIRQDRWIVLGQRVEWKEVSKCPFRNPFCVSINFKIVSACLVLFLSENLNTCLTFQKFLNGL